MNFRVCEVDETFQSRQDSNARDDHSSDCDCIAAVHNDKHDNDDNNGKKYEDEGEDLHHGIFQEIFDYMII